MRRLVRAAEPEPLRTARAEKLEAAGQAISGGETPALDGYSPEGVKAALFDGQSGKCAYCEKREEQAKYRDAEHYRPKSVYWWLTWTWENLLFACIDCNRDHKKEQFPLVDGAARLVARQPPPGAEQPLLLDPYDPSVVDADEIVFRRETVQRKERWRPEGLTARGRETVRICGLDRPSLIDLYTDHVRDVVRPKLERFRAAEEGSPQRVSDAWDTLRRGLFAPRQEFHALSRDALRALVPPALLQRYQLRL